MGGASDSTVAPKSDWITEHRGMIKPTKEEKFVGFAEAGRNGDSNPLHE